MPPGVPRWPARFDTLASREPAAIRGIVNRVSIVMANPADASQRNGATRVGRFGWKAGVPNLGQFAADAYLNEMGITTSSCNFGVANRSFGTENRANRAPSNAVINGCPDDLVPGTDDDFATEENNCAGGLTHGAAAVHWPVIRKIFFSWLLTIPASAVISYLLILSHI